jgi:hypothetical protein
MDADTDFQRFIRGGPQRGQVQGILEYLRSLGEETVVPPSQDEGAAKGGGGRQLWAVVSVLKGMAPAASCLLSAATACAIRTIRLSNSSADAPPSEQARPAGGAAPAWS